MPTTVTSTSGNTYHLFQLAEASYWEPEESIRFEELENDLGDGYFSQALYGANTGLRKWKLKLASLAHSDVLPNTVTDVSGATVSREEYLWNLFCHTKVTGEPFVFRSPRNGQYYLVRFADKDISYQKMRVKIYSTGVELKQVRVAGDSVFEIDADIGDLTSLFGWWNETGHASPNWTSPATFPYGGTSSMNASGDVLFAAATQNGLPIVRLNSVGTNGFLVTGVVDVPPTAPVDTVSVGEAFLVIKIREATFGQTSGVLTDDGVYGGVREWLVGQNGTTKFTNLGFSNYEYRLNGVLYGQSDQQAPMGTWGIVHLRFGTVPFTSFALQIGTRHSTGGTQAEIDVAEVIMLSAAGSVHTANQITEYLTVKWGIT